MYADRKFTDRDIRDNPVLVGVAEEYLRGYTGDFEFLVACESLLHNNGALPAPLARAVLNCMRNDPFAQNRLPKLTQPKPKPQPQTNTDDSFLYRPARITLRSKFKHIFALSQAKNASVAHIIRTDIDVVIYYPHIGRFSIRVPLWCGKTLSRKTKHTNDPEGRKVCGACFTNQHLYGAKEKGAQ